MNTLPEKNPVSMVRDFEIVQKTNRGEISKKHRNGTYPEVRKIDTPVKF